MVGFDFDDNPTASARAIKSYGLGEIKMLLRITEIFIVLILLTRSLPRLPLAGEHLRHLANIVAGHLFVFMLSNVLILVLFLKSRSLQDDNETLVDLCRDYTTTSGGDTHFAAEAEEAVVFEDKQTILEVDGAGVSRAESESLRLEEERCCGGCGKRLRWSEAEMVEEMSSEEFRRAIEAFIASKSSFIKKKN